ncbi:hypothetical protein EDEG_00345 [Edhazardia aedis USNM 41457]|uniref:Uncharacterized protein n=1 Tax=Edhazardia aedis (strain USNM 41457) TaxID=1003232 RepID=J9D1T9_EDHAE|nr:hypothetical protein EDEG_00345 [Edhazardia aedis USNM 41457]|eukprot:EJW01821.1 hypothetical protein EDEG_00345 [Edhazardia aedis USNM 41457]
MTKILFYMNTKILGSLLALIFMILLLWSSVCYFNTKLDKSMDKKAFIGGVAEYNNMFNHSGNNDTSKAKKKIDQNSFKIENGDDKYKVNINDGVDNADFNIKKPSTKGSDTINNNSSKKITVRRDSGNYRDFAGYDLMLGSNTGIASTNVILPTVINDKYIPIDGETTQMNKQSENINRKQTVDFISDSKYSIKSVINYVDIDRSDIEELIPKFANGNNIKYNSAINEVELEIREIKQKINFAILFIDWTEQTKNLPEIDEKFIKLCILELANVFSRIHSDCVNKEDRFIYQYFFRNNNATCDIKNIVNKINPNSLLYYCNSIAKPAIYYTLDKKCDEYMEITDKKSSKCTHNGFDDGFVLIPVKTFRISGFELKYNSRNNESVALLISRYASKESIERLNLNLVYQFMMAAIPLIS